MKPWLGEVDRWVSEIISASTKGRAYDLIVGEPLPEEWGGQGTMASYVAGCLALRAKETGDVRYLERAREFVLLPDPVHAFAASAAWEVLVALRAAHMLTDAEQERIRQAMTRTARKGIDHFLVIRMGIRRFNHAVTTGNLCDVISRLWPDAPESAALRQAAEDVWSDWWLIGENLEDAANYEAFAQIDLLLWGERRGEKERTLSDASTLYWIDRGLEHMLPVGIVPGYGDTCTMELWVDWFAQYAITAAWCDAERAQRGAWNAERMFEWATSREWLRQNIGIIEEVPEDPYRAKQGWGQMPRAAWYLALGREFLRNISVPTLPPPVRPIVTHRTIFAHDVLTDHSWSLMPPAGGARVADKVVLRLGDAPESATLMLGCARQIWHDHLDSGAIVSYASGRTVHLDDSGYMQKYPTFHNAFFAEDQQRPWLEYTHEEYAVHGEMQRPSDYHVGALTGQRVAQLAVIDCEVPHCMPIYHKRLTMLARNGVAVVLDSVEPYTSGLVGSPLWQLQRVHQIADHSIETSVDEFRGMNGQHCDNAPGAMWICAPLETSEWNIAEQDNLDPYASPNYREPVTRYFHYWKRAFVTRTTASKPRALLAGCVNRFVSVLVPAALIPAGTPDTSIEVLENRDGEVLAVRIADSALVLNHTEKETNGAWGSTDAMWLWHDGVGVFAHRVKQVAIAGLRLDTGGQWADLDLAWDADGIRGTISTERATTVTIEFGARSASFAVHGITTVDRAE